MTIFEIGAFLIGLSALFGYINHRFLKAPHTIGLVLIALAASLTIIVIELLLPATDAEAVWRMATNVVHAVRQLGLQHPIDSNRLMSLSAGVATSDGHFDLDGKALWVVADQAYQHARTGRGDSVATSEE